MGKNQKANLKGIITLFSVSFVLVIIGISYYLQPSLRSFFHGNGLINPKTYGFQSSFTVNISDTFIINPDSALRFVVNAKNLLNQQVNKARVKIIFQDESNKSNELFQGTSFLPNENKSFEFNLRLPHSGIFQIFAFAENEEDPSIRGEDWACLFPDKGKYEILHSVELDKKTKARLLEEYRMKRKKEDCKFIPGDDDFYRFGCLPPAVPLQQEIGGSSQGGNLSQETGLSKSELIREKYKIALSLKKKGKIFRLGKKLKSEFESEGLDVSQFRIEE